MWTISKTFTFSASHQLNDLPKDHPCSRLHGHNYEITVILKSETLTDEGFVQDYRDLKPIQEWIGNRLDHQHLNTIFTQPSVEVMTKTLFDIWKKQFPLLIAIEMSETMKTRCRYEP